MANVDAGVQQYFAADHRECDAAWAALEAAGDDPAHQGALFRDFEARLLRHLSMEEEVLFPAIEEATGMRGGPIAVMRHEHEQMRGLLAEMARRAAGGDFDGVIDQGDTLLMIIQQHNSKEEGILYPIAERALASSWPAIAERLRAYAVPG